MSDIKGVEIHDIFGLSQPLTKLVEVVSSGIGMLYEPTNIKRLAKAKAKEIEIVSNAVRGNIDLPQVYEDGKIKITTLDSQDISQRAALRHQYQEILTEQNIESVIMNAAEELKNEETVSEEPVDEDWATRFFSIVGEVSSEEIQFIWGKILAGEIKTPGSFSLRTLETLRNLSQNEARIFSFVAGYVFMHGDNFFVINEERIYQQFDLPFRHILLMEESGLMTLNELNLNISSHNQIEESIAIYNEKFICVAKNKHQQAWDLNLSIYSLTKAGIELFKIIDKHIQEQYSFACFNKIKTNEVEITVFEVIEILSNGSITYRAENPISI